MSRRYWMTGCMALIMLVAGRWPQSEDADGDQLNQRSRIALTSKYGLDETIKQLERSMRRSGLPVLAQTELKPRADEVDRGGASERARVLVLGDESGHTPVLQREGQVAPELPWRLLVRQRPDGRTDVWLTDAVASAPPDEVSAQTAEKVASLPALVKAAIT